jgi:hypothetical protein
MTQQMPRRAQRIEVINEDRLRAGTLQRDSAGHALHRAARCNGGEQQRHRRLAFPLQHAIDGPLGVREDRLRHEGGAVPPDHDTYPGPAPLGLFRKLNNFGDIREVVA